MLGARLLVHDLGVDDVVVLLLLAAGSGRRTGIRGRLGILVEMLGHLVALGVDGFQGLGDAVLVQAGEGFLALGDGLLQVLLLGLGDLLAVLLEELL